MIHLPWVVGLLACVEAAVIVSIGHTGVVADSMSLIATVFGVIVLGWRLVWWHVVVIRGLVLLVVIC